MLVVQLRRRGTFSGFHVSGFYERKFLMDETKAKNSFVEAMANFFKKDLVQYIVKRILMFIPTLLLISILVFFVIQLPPGDYVSAHIAALATEGELVDADYAASMRADYGLDLPVWQQYIKWVKDIIWTPTDSTYYRLYHSHHNWKYSFAYGRDVWSVVNDRLGLTIGVTFIIMLFQYLVSIPIAVYASTHQYSAGDYISAIIGFLGTAIPNFILAIVLMYLSYKWTGNANVGLFTQDMLQNGVHLYNFGDFMKRMIIPIVVIGTSGTCGIIRSVRAQMLDEVARQYTLTARAKGVSEGKIIMKYCFRAAMNPTVSGLGGVLSSLFSGSTVTAMVLNMQIQGPVLYKALQSQDMYLAGAIVMIQAVLVVIGVLLSDIALAFLDPRIRYSGGGR
jgi:peptide/nickel transport system permease protein